MGPWRGFRFPDDAAADRALAEAVHVDGVAGVYVFVGGDRSSPRALSRPRSSQRAEPAIQEAPMLQASVIHSRIPRTST